MSPEQLLDDDGDDNSSATSAAAPATTVSASDPLMEAGGTDYDLLEATTVWVGNFGELWVSDSVFVRIITRYYICLIVLGLGKD